LQAFVLTLSYRGVMPGDFEPVALLSSGPFVLTTRKAMPANDLKGLIAWLKANPDKATRVSEAPCAIACNSLSHAPNAAGPGHPAHAAQGT
jgi:tripartite-type tricarboxylate transporter receptor subunit TctC